MTLLPMAPEFDGHLIGSNSQFAQFALLHIYSVENFEQRPLLSSHRICMPRLMGTYKNTIVVHKFIMFTNIQTLI